MFRKVLIANRGEIAVRIAQALQEMGICAAAIYSEADHQAVHVTAADEAYCLEGSSAAETYLRGDKIIEVARVHQADAVHPGYGFLSENADFAEACRQAGLVFIGPSPEIIRAMGDKVAARAILSQAGVPVVPGWSSDQEVDLAEMRAHAAGIGYPIMIKAAAGGGGRGMRVVTEEQELQSAIEAAQREARSAFADDRIFIEKYIAKPRHVEFQIFGDQHGRIAHLFERECSVQRRHQKIVEEAPSPALNSRLREEMGAAAVRVAETLGYTNAGTVEFILDQEGRFYFLEVNTRLQVEHPVTELILGRDLVKAQVRVASGAALPFEQPLPMQGHAMECRIYAEDASRNFLPAVGRISHYLAPSGVGIRVDSGVARGSEVSVHYDPLLAKLVVWAPNRAEALHKMHWALRHFVILGVTTNIEFLQNLVAHPEFQAGNLHTHFLQDHVVPPRVAGAADEILLAAAFAAGGVSAGHAAAHAASTASQNPWRSAGPWRG